MKALDLFCGAGGAARGLQQAGFHVTGVDIAPQPRYAGDVFVQADALTFPLDGFDFVWASPPCQFGSVLTSEKARDRHPNLIPATRARLQAGKVPHIIENVAGSREHLVNPIMLCGSMFGLGVWRHRYFEAPCIGFLLTLSCNHSICPAWDGQQGTNKRLGWQGAERELFIRQQAMGIDWMNKAEISLAIPPAYSHFLGLQVIAALQRVAA